MDKRNGINKKLLTGWLLLLLFALPPAAKTIHICHCVYVHDAEHEQHNHQTEHDCDSCAICQFVLFPFTETESTELTCTIETTYSSAITYNENITSSVTYNYMLRAPPRA
ncbi:MAG: hypothetical protein LBS43_00480 [Prevotellaceae bacterium]|jgi:hypothetical protein|nr:hypothetical protein [Prevotellaceae bacterium]